MSQSHPNPILRWNRQFSWPVLYPEFPPYPVSCAAVTPMGLLGSVPTKLQSQICTVQCNSGLARKGFRILPMCQRSVPSPSWTLSTIPHPKIAPLHPLASANLHLAGLDLPRAGWCTFFHWCSVLPSHCIANVPYSMFATLRGHHKGLIPAQHDFRIPLSVEEGHENADC